MSVFRSQHTANFTTISNRLFDDVRLKADEVGILAFLISRPHNWELRRSALQRRWDIGPMTMKRIVNNWMRYGWCKATKKRLPNGTFCIVYDIFDLPGEEQTDEQIREALSLVSSEASPDEVVLPDEKADHHPPAGRPPPPSQPVLASHPLADHGVAYIDSTKTDSANTDGCAAADARGASGKFSSPEAAALAERLLIIAGHDPKFWPPGWCGAPRRVQTWLNNGWPAEIIVAAVTASVRRRPGITIDTVHFFEKAVAEEVARQARPLPTVEVRQAEKLTVTRHGTGSQGSGIIQAADSLNAALDAFDEGAGSGAEELRSEARPPPVRLLSQG